MSWWDKLFGEARPASKAPAAATTVIPPPRPALREPVPFHDTDVLMFLDVARGLAGNVRAKLDPNSRGTAPAMPRMLMVDKETGVEFDLSAAMGEYIENASLLYGFGVTCFIACIFCNRWEKTEGRRKVQADFLPDMVRHNLAGMIPKLEVTPEAARAHQEEAVNYMVETASLAAWHFWSDYYDNLYSGGRRTSKKEILNGRERLRRWLDDPSTFTPNPMALLQVKLGKVVGGPSGGPDFQKRTEAEYGELTRALIREGLAKFGLSL